MMGSIFYDLFMLPLERFALTRLRRQFIPRAEGRILELGAGTGVNLRYYDRRKVGEIILSDLRPGRRIRRRAVKAGARFVAADVEALPFADESFDTVVFTLLFCSVADPKQGMREIRRVLKPGGRIVFIEHVLGCTPSTRKLQQRLTPIWRRISGNCHLDRDTLGVIEQAGFIPDEIDRRADCVLMGGIARR